jgi:hypothetical protein
MTSTPSRGQWMPLSEAVSLVLYECDWEQFEEDLSAAGFAGEVRFSRLVGGLGVEIDPRYFKQRRGFSDLQDSIFPDGSTLDQRFLSEIAIGASLIGSGHDFEDVFVERAGFIAWLHRTYPALSPRPESPEAQCASWLIAEIEKSPDRRPNPRKNFETEARKKFEGLSVPGFDRAWKAAIKDTKNLVWNRGGAPKKNPSENPPEKK